MEKVALLLSFEPKLMLINPKIIRHSNIHVPPTMGGVSVLWVAEIHTY